MGFTPTGLRSSTRGMWDRICTWPVRGWDWAPAELRSFSHECCNRIFQLDGEEEFVIYTAPVGTVRDSDRAQEHAFYQFVEDEGL